MPRPCFDSIISIGILDSVDSIGSIGFIHNINSIEIIYSLDNNIASKYSKNSLQPKYDIRERAVER